jgi:hypothetical protein
VTIRLLAAAPVVAALTVVAALVATADAGVAFRDPDHVAALYVVEVGAGIALLVAVDIFLRAARRAGRRWPPRETLRAVRRERWTARRAGAVAVGLLSFYVSYLAYRNLKSVVPLIRPELFDQQLAELDRSLFGGNDPAALLHDLLGTGVVTTQVVSASYMLFFVFIPGTLAFALVFTPNLQAGLFYATAQSLNWLLGAASYFLLPSLGPIYFDPAAFAHLPATGVSDLQSLLLDQRVEFLRDPAAGLAQSIGAFASLHVSIFFTGVLAAHLLGFGRSVRVGAWVLLGLTTIATIYLGWHYVLDDVGGVVLGALALILARALTGFDLRTARQPAPLSRPNPTPA